MRIQRKLKATLLALTIGAGTNVYAAPLPPGVAELDGIDDNLPEDDLTAIDRVIVGATNVALGESIHASGGFIKIKFRLIKYLVERHGFRALALETNRQSAEVIEKFIRDGEGTALTAARRFGIWASTEAVALFQWLRAYNVAHPHDAVSVFGFDVQQPRVDHDFLATFLQRAASLDAVALLEGVSSCNLSAANSYGEAEYQRCLQGLAAMDDYLLVNRPALIAATSAQDYVESRICFTGLKSWQTEWFYYRSDIRESMEARDAGMAKVFRTIVRTRYSPQTKTILWAHNWHISMHTDEMPAYRNATSMGTHLRRSFGRSYVALGVFGYEVGIDWPNVGCGIQPVSSEEDSMELILNRIGPPFLFADLTVLRPVLPRGRDFKSYMSGHFQMKPGRQFNALLFLRRSEKMDPVAWQPCSPQSR